MSLSRTGRRVESSCVTPAYSTLLCSEKHWLNEHGERSRRSGLRSKYSPSARSCSRLSMYCRLAQHPLYSAKIAWRVYPEMLSHRLQGMRA